MSRKKPIFGYSKTALRQLQMEDATMKSGGGLANESRRGADAFDCYE